MNESITRCQRLARAAARCAPQRSAAALVIIVATMSTLMVGYASLAPMLSVARADAAATVVAYVESQEGTPDSPADTYCNKYSGAFGDGWSYDEEGNGKACAAGYRSIFWCADFARYAWQQAGYDISGLNANVSSFQTYGESHGTWHAVNTGYTPQPGDAAIYGTAHLGIVVSNGTSGPNVVNGDWGTPSVVSGIVRNQTTNGAGAALTGYVTPTGAGSGTIGNGSFVSNDGFVYRIAGGAPIYVSTWSIFGGPQPTTPLTDAQFAALPEYPADGTVLDASGGDVFVVAGGAPLYVSSWDAIGGPQPGVEVDEAAVDNAGNGAPWDHLRQYPADGTILDASGGGVFVVAGGAPLYVSNYAAIGGPQGGTRMDEWDIDNPTNPNAHLRQYPADGTILDASDGNVYVVAGGAPLYVSTYAAIGGPQPGTRIDAWDIDNPANPNAHLRQYPSNGTFINALTSTGSEFGAFVIAGGAPIAISSWSAFGGEPADVTTVDSWDVVNPSNSLAHLRPYPADGTFVSTMAGNSFVIAGGAAFVVTDWSTYGGEPPGVTEIDQWAVDNAGGTTVGLLGAPAAGTVVAGLPSGQAWVFSSTCRSQSTATGGTLVPDASVNAYPTCVVAPVVASISPNAGAPAGGGSVTITGSGFTGASKVQFGGGTAGAVFTVNSDSSITATVPAHAAGVVNVFVTTPVGVSAAVAADRYTYATAAVAPVVSAVAPSTGSTAGATNVTITGTGFTGATKVQFGGGTASATFTVVSDTKITATTPAHAAGVVNVFVTTPAGASSAVTADRFTYAAAPTVTGVTPATGTPAGGTTVVITGTGFTGATKVQFGGGATPSAAFTVNSDTKITATAPAHASGVVNIYVTTPVGVSAAVSADQYRYAAPAPVPTITGVSPATGPAAGGSTVTITGTGFTGATKVQFGGGTTPSAAFTVVNDTTITATTPAHTTGTVNVYITTPGGTTTPVTADHYTYT